MIKYRQETIACTLTLSYPFNDNMSSYQENMLLCQRVFGGRILNLGNNGQVILAVKYLVALNSLSISIGGETMTAQIPFPSSPLDFGVEANGFMYFPTAYTYSSELVRCKQGVYISGESAS